MTRRKRDRIKIHHQILRQFVRFFAQFDLRRFGLVRSRVREKRRNRRQQGRDRVSNGSGFHFVMASAQCGNEDIMSSLINSIATTQMRVNRGAFSDAP